MTNPDTENPTPTAPRVTAAAYARCRTCNAEIVWALTTNGRRIPLDVSPASNGNVALKPDGTCEVYSAAQLASAQPRTPLRLSHFATCPDAHQHRRR